MSKERKRIINDRYALMSNPKHGGMSDVYGANDLDQDGRKVALKLFRTDEIEQDIIFESFKRETRALKELKHQNVVALLDSGVDDETTQYFIVMEWVDHNLSEWIKEAGPLDWDSFYNQIGRPVVEALAFAHSRQFIHRDLKTKNILVDARGLPKLADFGIAKLRTLLQPGVTLFDFGSKPFTPPTDEDEAYSFTRDVYGFGVVVLDCLTDIQMREREDVEKALAKFNAPSEICNIIERAVSMDRFQRHQTADILLADLLSVQERRFASEMQRRSCFIRLSQRALEVLRTHLSEPSQRVIEKRILEDLNMVCAIKAKDGAAREANTGRHFDIFGAEYSYHVVIDDRDEDHLFIINVWPSSQIVLDKQREAAWPSNYEFRFGYPIDSIDAKDVLRELQLETDRFQADYRAIQLERLEERLFRTWGDVLRAKRNVEDGRRNPIEYHAVSIQGTSVRFKVGAIPEDDLIGQPWRVRLHDRSILSGLIDDVRERELMLDVQFGDTSLLPPQGRLEFNDYAATLALDREQRALDDIRFDRVSMRPDLRRLIVHPEQAQAPHPRDLVEFVQDRLDDPKREAVLAALGTDDFLVVEGPPGTGKTTFIVEVILQTLAEHPDARILLTSQTHVALDNAVDKIRKHLRDLKIVRIGRINSKGESRVSPESQELLVENLMYKWREVALSQGKEFLTRWAAERNISQSDVAIGMKLEELAVANTILEDKRRTLADLQTQNKEFGDIAGGLKPEVELASSEEILGLEEEISRLKDESKNYRRKKQEIEKELQRLEDEEIVSDLLSMSADEQREWAKYYFTDKPEAEGFKKLTNIYVEWKERFGVGDEFKPALLISAQVIAGTCVGIAGVRGTQEIEYDLCIVDEASKATPTETLVPMVRSRSWILVGDQMQLPPFVDDALRDKELLRRYDLAEVQLKETLFDHLRKRLPEACRKRLTTQHRMVAPIGRLISECFYDKSLESAKKELDTYLGIDFKRPVTWFSTAKRSNRMESRAGSSWVNDCEVNFIVQLLKRIDFVAAKAKKSYEVAVLSGYLGQKMHFDRAFASHKWESISVDCNTVDAYQGREADIAIYSVTRANDDDRIGHLSAAERVNVALSRGRYYLGIVGDHYFCRWTDRETPLKKVVRYIENHPEDCHLDVI
jgi:serine/threonine protein kinase